MKGNLRKMKAIIFDMDGVIFDSERAVYEGWKELSKKYGFDDLDTVYRKCIGVNRDTARKLFIEHYGKEFPYDEYKEEQSAKYHELYDGGRLPLKSGVEDLLNYLKEKGFQIAIASSTRTWLVEQQIKDAGLEKYFNIMVGGDQVERSKPEPDVFLKAAQLLGSKPEETYVVEDSYNGIRAASAAKMIPIMVPDMVAPDAEIEDKAWRICETLRQVKSIL